MCETWKLLFISPKNPQTTGPQTTNLPFDELESIKYNFSE